MIEEIAIILVYADRVETTDKKDKRSKKASELHIYLSTNKEGLLPYQKQGKEITAPKEGITMKIWECRNLRIVL